MLTCIKRNIAQKYRDKSQFPIYGTAQIKETIILPMTTEEVQENKTDYVD
jgi:hypothetical protein